MFACAANGDTDKLQEILNSGIVDINQKDEVGYILSLGYTYFLLDETPCVVWRDGAHVDGQTRPR